jgi:hypothetical protein
MYIAVCMNEALVFLTILKLFKISGLQTKMTFKQRFKYEKINLIKVILKL